MSDDDEALQDHVAGPAVPQDALSRELLITNKRGLNARASAKFVQTVERYQAEVCVTRGGETVGGRAIMGLKMRSAAPGTSILVSSAGPEAVGALQAISDLVNDKFLDVGL